LVCCMLANNETGAIMPVHDISVAVKRKNPNVKVFSDCVQAFLKMHFTVSSIGADLISITGHKVHAPKGCGALYVKEGALIRPIIYGGGQEKKLRSGTESLPLIAAFSEAVKIGSSSLEDNIEKTQALHDFAVSELSKIDGVSILDIHGLPHVISMSLKGAKSEVLLRVLESEGVYVSSGSACAKGKKSHVLTNMGLPNAVIDSTLRISMDHTNTKDDILALARSIENAKILF